MGDTSSSLTFYPPHLFKYSPTYTSWARLTAADLHHRLYRRSDRSGIALDDLWYFTNHPIRWVRIVGIIVAYDEWEKRTQITIDDGSGELIDVIAWKTPSYNHGSKTEVPPPDLTGVHLHAIVKVKGSVDEFRERKQMRLRKVEVIKDTTEEVRCWKEMVEWKRSVLMQPWVVDAKTVRKTERALRKEKRKFLEREQKRKRGEGEGGEEGRRKRGRLAEEKAEFKGRRRPEGFRPPQPPRPRNSPTPQVATRKDWTEGETKDVGVETRGAGKFRGRKRPPDYKLPPRPRVSRSPSPALCVAKKENNNYLDIDFGVRHTSPAAAGCRDVKDYSDLESSGATNVDSAPVMEVEAVPSNSEIRMEGDQTVQERGRRRARSQLSTSPKSPATKRDYSYLDFGGLVSSKPPAAAKMRDDYSDLDFVSSGQEESRSNRVIGTKISGNGHGAISNSQSVVDDTSRRRRIRIVPTEKFIPPPLSQTQDITLGNDPPNSQPGNLSSDPMARPAFRGRRRPGTVPSEPAASQQSQGRTKSQNTAAIFNMKGSYTTPADPQTYPGTMAALQMLPSQTKNGAKKGNSAAAAPIEHDPYTMRFSRPAQNPQPQPTFRGHRRTEPSEYTDAIPSTISTYNPTQTYKGRRREPSARVIKAAILAYLHSTEAATISSQSLLSTTSIAALAPSVELVTSALQAMAADGYLLPTNTADFWVVVSYQQLSDIIDSEAKNAMRRSRDRVVLVGRVWRRAGARGGHWNGVGKEVVGEVLAGHFGVLEGWVEVKGGWEWRGV
ncbi:telomere regulation protein Stn1-domain-containing protein [Trichophaea hybrida]|nr:telomere regulation protein Stn1-domain-containing protein [Trichophaea hybrida]